jgi:hypothetical protein
MEFLFTPSDYNKISNIIINWDANKNRWSYKLEDEKKNLEDFKTNWNNDEYSFEDFFYYTFLQNESTSTTGTSTVTTNTNVCTSDDSSPTIASFKRTLILENEWRFSPLLWFIKVDYEDICVEDIEYNVSIKNAGLTYGTTTKYTWIFSSKYIPKEEVFENPSIIFQDENGFSKLYWNAVNFQWKFKIKELKSNLEPFFERFENYNNIINSLNYDLQISKFSITYITTSESLVIENWELRLWIRRNQIYSFVYNWKEILKNNTNYEIKDLDSILKLIK